MGLDDFLVAPHSRLVQAASRVDSREHPCSQGEIRCAGNDSYGISSRRFYFHDQHWPMRFGVVVGEDDSVHPVDIARVRQVRLSRQSWHPSVTGRPVLHSSARKPNVDATPATTSRRNPGEVILINFMLLGLRARCNGRNRPSRSPERSARSAERQRDSRASISLGSTLWTSPTMPRSAMEKMGASESLLMAMMFFEPFMPTRCWVAPEMPQAM